MYDLARSEASTSWHTVLSFNPGANAYLRTMQKGWQVYVEANYELREADPAADPESHAAQRQILLRHGASCCYVSDKHDLMLPTESIRVLKRTPGSDSS